jgi:hypothetical protein
LLPNIVSVLNEVMDILDHVVWIHDRRYQAVHQNDNVPEFEIHSILSDCVFRFLLMLLLYRL